MEKEVSGLGILQNKRNKCAAFKTQMRAWQSETLETEWQQLSIVGLKNQFKGFGSLTIGQRRMNGFQVSGSNNPTDC